MRNKILSRGNILSPRDIAPFTAYKRESLRQGKGNAMLI